MKEQNSYSLPDPKAPFKVPESYFETFDEQLFSKWDSQRIPPRKKTFLITRYVYIGVAASITLFIGIQFFINTNQEALVSHQEIENYLQTNSIALPSEVTQELTDADLKALEQSLNLDHTNLDDYLLSSTDIEYYLNE